jgi:oligoendopeptidase F
MDVAKKNVGVFQRFFKLKARLLGMERLRRYDVYAPVAKSEKPFAYPKAAEMVLESFGQFHPKFAEMAERVFAENRLDAEVRKGKRGGAF